jgi:CRISPR/Cas system-associated exonuclease Cas4 (RecB family)
VTQLVSIADLADVPGAQVRQMLKHVSIIGRVEAFLEDLNTDPMVTLPAEFDMGSAGRRKNIMHASSIGGQSGKTLCGKFNMGCGRLLYYELTGEKAVGAWEPRMRRILDTGTAIHAQLQAYLGEVAARSEGEEEFTPEADVDPEKNDIGGQYDVSGHTDGIYHIHVPMELRFGLEIKSINDAGYKGTSAPHPEHLTQVTLYQKAFDLPVMVLIYYNKNDSNVAEFIHVFDDRHWEAIAKKLTHIQECAINGELPVQEAGFHCYRCKFKGVCKPPQRRRGTSSQRFRGRR